VRSIPRTADRHIDDATEHTAPLASGQAPILKLRLVGGFHQEAAGVPAAPARDRLGQAARDSIHNVIETVELSSADGSRLRVESSVTVKHRCLFLILVLARGYSLTRL
jgi:hypothetical protein